jgi:DivIVA domain-containing protein
VGLDRPGIARTDFPTARRGYDPEAVDRHLAEVADAVERLARERERPSDGLAGAASEQVRAIVEAAENAGAELRERAAAQSRDHVARVARLADELIARIERLEGELSALVESVKVGAERVRADLTALERDVARVGAPTEGAAPPRDAAPPVRSDTAPPAPSDAAPPARSDAAPVEQPDPRVESSARSDDAEGARLVALDMALSGSSRGEVDTYLSEHYALDDLAKLLDDVFATVGA